MKVTTERVAALRDQARRLDEIRQHPSWGELRRLFEERRRKHYERLTKQLLDGSEIDQRWVDRMAGFFKGAEWILDNPDQAEASLRSALKRTELLRPATSEGTDE